MRREAIGAILGATAGLTVAATYWSELQTDLWDRRNDAGHYLKQDDPRALPLFLALARRGDRKAAAVLTDIYVKDTLVPQDDKRALYWADQSDDPAQLVQWYANAFRTGSDGLPRDPERARLWLNHARSSQASRQ
jgi:TPR repeat protein